MNEVISQLQAQMGNLAKRELDWAESVFSGFHQSYERGSDAWCDELVRSALVISQLLNLVALLEARKV